MQKIFLCSFAAILATALAFQASADALYSNVSTGSNRRLTGVSFSIGSNNQITDSFTLTGTATLSSISLSLLDFGDPLTTVDWKIGTTPFGSEIASGTSAFTSSASDPSYNYSLALHGSLSNAGTYYITLSNALSDNDGLEPRWISNSGASTAYEDSGGSIENVNSDAFTLYGTDTQAVTVPDTGTTVQLLGLGVAALFGMRRVFAGRFEEF